MLKRRDTARIRDVLLTVFLTAASFVHEYCCHPKMAVDRPLPFGIALDPPGLRAREPALILWLRHDGFSYLQSSALCVVPIITAVTCPSLRDLAIISVNSHNLPSEMIFPLARSLHGVHSGANLTVGRIRDSLLFDTDIMPSSSNL